MTNPHPSESRHAAFGKAPRTRPVDPDGVVRWECSMKGWNCCIDKGVPVRPYDMLRLRHALGRSSAELMNDESVVFAWSPESGGLIGSLAQRPYERNRVACQFLDEITNVDAREMREHDPQRFGTMPEQVRRAADSTAAGEWKVAGLCRAHTGRPEACRGFPYQRQVELLPDGSAGEVSVVQVHRCGSCALSTPTTPRQVMADEQLEEFWRARQAHSQVERYLRSLGMANIEHEQYRAFPVAEVAELLGRMYLPDTDERITAAFPEQWRAPLDLDGDRAIHRMLLDQAMDRAEEMVAQSGEPPAAWGGVDGELERPDVDALLDRSVPLLPPPAPAHAGLSEAV